MKISLVVPCYNEEANLQKGVLDKIGNFVTHDDRFLEVLIVDDGSTDNSKKIIRQRYLPAFAKFRLIENPHQGKAHAIIAGVKSARGQYVIFSDIDLATPIEESQKLILEARDYPIVIGSRNAKRRGAPILRKLMAVGFIVVRNLVMGLRGIRDTQCGFKLFEKKIALDVIKRLQVFGSTRDVVGSSVSAGFDLEFLFIASRLGYRIKEVPVTWRHVETKNVNFLKDSRETLVDMARIKYNDLRGRYKKSYAKI